MRSWKRPLLVIGWCLPILLVSGLLAAGPPKHHTKSRPESLEDRLTRTLLVAAKKYVARKVNAPDEILAVPGSSGEKEYTRAGKHELVGDLNFDIQKTNSIISPYMGIVQYRIKLYTTPKFSYASREEAKRAPLTGTILYDYTLTYAYQHNQWVFKDSRFIHPDASN